MTDELAIYYRGPLHSCNYACEYCPFAKTADTKASLARDARALRRFVEWAEDVQDRTLRILLTPWGEALIRRHYREAMITLSHAPGVRRIAAQTNLSFDPRWLERADPSAISLWCTYHPSQVSRAAFLERCATLDELGIRYCVGMVGIRSDIPEIEAMRDALPASTYLWVNAFKRVADYYDPSSRNRILGVDPLFGFNERRHASRGHICATGDSSIMVDGDGVIRRCHFVDEVLGNLYEPGWESGLHRRRCPNETCGCYIGYVHLERLRLGEVYGEGLVERLPVMA